MNSENENFGRKYRDENNIIRTSPSNYQPKNCIGVEFFCCMKRNKDQYAQYMAKTGDALTYGELLQNSIRTALKLKSQNITQNDIICLCTYNHENSAVPFIASLFLGIQVASLDPTLSQDDIVHLIKQVKPKIFFIVPESEKLIEESLKLAELDATIVIFGESDSYQNFSEYLEYNENENSFHPVKTSIFETAVIFFSSGTTGLPKGICHNSYALLSQGKSFADAVGLGAILFYATLYWVSSVMFLAGAILLGETRVVCEKFNPFEVWKLIGRYKINFLFLAPIQAIEMLKVGRPDGIDTTSLQNLVTGGGIFPEKQLLALRDVLPGSHIMQAYGQTEVAGILTYFNPANVKDVLLSNHKPNSSGTPLLGIDYKVVDTETEEILGPNQKGELRVKTQYVMNGYYNLDSSESFDEFGWLKTGDVVYYDEDLCFYIVDRIKEMLKYKSFHVSPAVLENILLSHPAVKRAVVIGIPHEEDGDHPMALVIRNEEMTDVSPEEIIEFVNEKVIDRQKLRGGLKFVETFPITASGKIKRVQLKQMVLSGQI